MGNKCYVSKLNLRDNKLIRRVVSLVCATVLVFVLPVSSFAAEQDLIPDTKVTYTVSASGTTLTIGGSGVIPSNAFAANGTVSKTTPLSKITKIVVGSGITEIGTYAFTGCINVTTVVLNEGLKTIRIGAFANCPKLKTVTIPKSVTHVQDGAFRSKGIIAINKSGGLEAYPNTGYKTNDTLKFTYLRDYAKAYDMLDKINAARSSKKLSPLIMNASLLEVAMIRGAENVILFSQFRPNGEEGSTIYGRIAGEINAAGGATANSAFNSLAKNASNQNLFYNAKYQSVGIGCVQYNGVHYWAICFGDSNVITKPTPRLANKTITEAIEFPYGANKIIVDGKSYNHNFKIDTGNLTLQSGTTKQANLKLGVVTFLKSSVKWTSENPKVAKVSSSGVITAVAPGTTRIWAGSSKTPKRASITVKVNAGGLYKVNGKWQYYESGKLKKSTGLVKRPDNGKWHYVKNGIYSRITTLTKKVENDGKWYYVYKGDFKTATGLVKRASDGKWFYVKNGIYTKATTLTKKVANDGKWYYVQKGDFKKVTGLVKRADTGTWHYVKNGVYDRSFSGICARVDNGKKFYVVKGDWQKKYNGVVTYYGKRYTIKNGVVV